VYLKRFRYIREIRYCALKRIRITIIVIYFDGDRCRRCV